MIKIWILILFLVFTLVGCSTQPIQDKDEEKNLKVLKQEHLDSDYIEWYGRQVYQNNRMYFYFTATGFKVAFYGRVLEIDLYLENKNNDIYYVVAKNGENLLTSDIYVQSDTETTWLIDFDTFDFHVVEVVKRSEPSDGVTSLKEMRTNGYFTKVEKESKLHFLMIGASGISGNGALGEPFEPRTTLNSSSLHAFGFLTAQAFDGSYEFVSSSGWGLAFGFNDLSGVSNILEAYDFIGIDANQQIVNIPSHHAKMPDFIIVNIGGNDFTSVINRMSGFERTEKIQVFKAAVETFIFKLRNNAPNAHILWTMTEGSMNGSTAFEVINMLDLEDRQFVHQVIIKQVGEDGDLPGANNHASYITHQKSAQNIVEIINQIKSN